ncbi:MAG: integration host factor subunit beta [Myxococcales bacterium]|nr:integration host factor subunit beta [Myxococcales bacterium]
MTKAEIIEAVAERFPHFTKKDTEVVVNTILERMTAALAEGDKIEIRGFGSFRVKSRAPRQGRNPKTGVQVSIPAKRVPVFKPGKELVALLEGAASPNAGEGERPVE